VTAARFRPCDFKNLGLTSLCTFGKEGLYPPIWGSSVTEQYENAMGGKDKVPEYITANVTSNRRSYVNKAQVEYRVLDNCFELYLWSK
jgi:hypothetical protein